MDISTLNNLEDIATFQNLFKKEEYRSLDHSETFLLAGTELTAVAHSGPTSENIELVTNILRMLRNCCVNCHDNQEKLMRLKIPDAVIKIISSAAQVDDKTKVLRMCGLQFLGNFVANNRTTRDYLWKISFPETFEYFFDQNFEEKHFNVLVMILYNCLMPSNALDELLTSEKGKKIVGIICGRLSALENQEWSLLCITQHFINHKNLFPFIFSECSVDVQCDVLSVICDTLKHGEREKHEPKWIPSAVSTIAKQLVNDVQTLRSEFIKGEESERFSLLLQSLCWMTAIPGSCFLQEEDGDDLVAHIIILLRDICKTSQIKNKTKSSSQTASNTTESSPSSPKHQNKINLQSNGTGHCQLAVHCLRRDLIRLIGNLCFQNRLIQDKVRNLEAIPLILESCNIDDENPFMQQWALFTIRNLCEGNPANQLEIAKLEKLGIADSPVLRSLGLNAVEDENGKLRLVQNTN